MLFATGVWHLVFLVSSAGWAGAFSVYLLVVVGRHCCGGLCSQMRSTAS